MSFTATRPETLLPRFVDDSHPAAGDFLQQFVVAERMEELLLNAVRRAFLNDGHGRAAKVRLGLRAQW